jgi:uncharacterized linocin/CFP29 family protein
MTLPVAQVDAVTQSGGGSSAHGSVAMRLMQGNFDVAALRLNADINAQGILRKDEWAYMDAAVLPVARQRLVAIGDMISRGLSMPLPGALGKTRVEWERVSSMDPATVSMSGVASGGNDRVDFDLEGVPIPIVHRDFFLNIRALEASRNGGTPLDTTQIQLATRLVAEKNEAIFFAGTTLTGTNNRIYGISNHPNRNTGNVTATWLTATGEQIIGDVNTMIGTLIGDHMYGPYVLYVPQLVNNKLDNDFKAASDKTIRQRILEIPSISAIIPTENLAGTNIILMQMTSDVADIIDGLQPTTVMWETLGGFQINFKVMSILVPRIRSDYSGQSGIAHLS